MGSDGCSSRCGLRGSVGRPQQHRNGTILAAKLSQGLEGGGRDVMSPPSAGIASRHAVLLHDVLGRRVWHVCSRFGAVWPRVGDGRVRLNRVHCWPSKYELVLGCVHSSSYTCCRRSALVPCHQLHGHVAARTRGFRRSPPVLAPAARASHTPLTYALQLVSPSHSLSAFLAQTVKSTPLYASLSPAPSLPPSLAHTDGGVPVPARRLPPRAR